MSAPALVPLRELLVERSDPHLVDPETQYPIAGVYGFGRGMIRRKPVSGQEIAAENLFRIKKDQFIYSRLKSFEGAFALVTSETDGYFVSNEFPTFDVDRTKLEPAYLDWYFRQPKVWKQLATGGKGIGARRERLPSERLLAHSIGLPSLEQQRRIALKLSTAASGISRSLGLAEFTRSNLRATLTSAFRKIIAGAPRLKMGTLAPVTRRQVEVDPNEIYEELGVRSFGRGLFKKPDIVPAELTWQKLFHIRDGDIVFSNIKAWEGAFAVAGREHDGKVGSHRYLTSVVDLDRATPLFVWYFLQSPEGLARIQSASPGSADRNRTLNQKKLAAIEVPVPSLDAQIWFDTLQAKCAEVGRRQQAVTTELDRLMPAMLHAAFG